LEVGEQPEGKEASEDDWQSLEGFRDRAIEYDEKVEAAKATEDSQSLNQEQMDDGMEAFRGQVEDRYPEDLGHGSDTKEVKQAPEAIATVAEDPATEPGIGVEQNARPELQPSDSGPEKAPPDSMEEVEPGARKEQAEELVTVGSKKDYTGEDGHASRPENGASGDEAPVPEKAEAAEAPASPDQEKKFDQERPAQAGQEEPSKEAPEPYRDAIGRPDVLKVEEASGAPKLEEAPAETPARIDSYNRNDDPALMVAHEAPEGHGREPEQVQTSDLRRLQDSPFELQAIHPNTGQGQSLESDAKLESSREKIEDSPAVSKPFDNQFRATDRASLQTGEPGREIEYEPQVTVLKGIDSAKEPDSRVPERVGEREDSIDVLKASGYGHTSALLVPERMIPPHDQRLDVFEVRISRESEPEKEFSLYATHKPGYDRAYLNLYQLEPEKGEEFRVKPATPYTLSDFVEEYNGAKPRGLENTTLVERGRDLYLKAGETELPFVESKLRVYQGRVVIDGNVEGAGEVKISKGLEGFDFRLKDHSRVIGVEEGSQGVMLSYERTGHDPYPHRRILVEGKVESFPAAKREVPLIAGRIDVVSRSIEGNTLRFGLKADEEAVEHVMNDLDSARNIDEFRKLKGDIAEELVKKVAPSLGLIVRADHPFNDDPLKTGSERTGPDLLASLGAHGDLSYVEVKWWAITANAKREATIQVQQDLHKHPTWNSLPVKVAYTAIVDWRPESDEFSLTLERVDGNGVGANGFNR
jgi:hypothetical protein